MPQRSDLEQLFELDGVLIDTDGDRHRLRAWQDRMAPAAADLPYIAFAQLTLHQRWLALTAPEDYANGIMR